MAINDSFDLYELSKSDNSYIRKIADVLTNVVINISQGT
jgi:hypothetical protein